MTRSRYPGRDRQQLHADDAGPAAQVVPTRTDLAGEVHVVVPDRGAVDRLAQIGAVDEHVEVGTRRRRLVVVVDAAVSAIGQVDAEALTGCGHVDGSRTEQRHVMAGGEHLGDAAVDLFAAAERRPVEVVHAHTEARARGRRAAQVRGHLTTSHSINERRDTFGLVVHRSATMPGSSRRYPRQTFHRWATSARTGRRRVSGRMP